jgi:hypothetical protein
MLKELKYFLFLFAILLFLFLSLKYYFSDNNKKNSYRSLKLIDKKNYNYSQNLILLKNDTEGVVEYVKKTMDRDKKNYNFWKLINNNE